MVITVKWLMEQRACAAGVKKFRQLFGRKAVVNLTNLNKLASWGTKNLGRGEFKIVNTRNSDGSLIFWIAATLGDITNSNKSLGIERKILRLDCDLESNTITLPFYKKEVSKLAFEMIEIAHEQGVLD